MISEVERTVEVPQVVYEEVIVEVPEVEVKESWETRVARCDTVWHVVLLVLRCFHPAEVFTSFHMTSMYCNVSLRRHESFHKVLQFPWQSHCGLLTRDDDCWGAHPPGGLFHVVPGFWSISRLESLTWKCFKMLYLWFLCLSEILEFSGPCPCDPVHRTKLRLYIALWSVIPRKWDIFFADMDIAEKILIHLWKYYLWMFSGQTRAKAELASCGESRSMSSSPSRGAQCTKLPVSF